MKILFYFVVKNLQQNKTFPQGTCEIPRAWLIVSIGIHIKRHVHDAFHLVLMLIHTNGNPPGLAITSPDRDRTQDQVKSSFHKLMYILVYLWSVYVNNVLVYVMHEYSYILGL